MSTSVVESGQCRQCNRLTKMCCNRCGDFFCSTLCQKLNWGYHRYICFQMPTLKEKVTLSSHLENVETCGLNESRSSNSNEVVDELSEKSGSIRNDFRKQNHKINFSDDVSTKSKRACEQQREVSLTERFPQKSFTISQLNSDDFDPNQKYSNNINKLNSEYEKSVNGEELKCFPSTSPNKTGLPFPESRVWVANFRSANRCYIRHISSETNCLHQKNIEISNNEGENSTSLDSLPSTKQWVYARYGYKNITWARATILYVKNKSNIRVVFNDFGIVAMRRLGELREMTPKGRILKECMLLVQLHNVRNFEFNDKIFQFLNGKQRKEMRIRYGVQSQDPKVLINHAIFYNLENNECLNDELNIFYDKSSTIYSNGNDKNESISTNSEIPNRNLSKKDKKTKNTGNVNPNLSNQNDCVDSDEISSVNSDDFGFSPQHMHISANGLDDKKFEMDGNSSNDRKRSIGERPNDLILTGRKKETFNELSLNDQRIRENDSSSDEIQHSERRSNKKLLQNDEISNSYENNATDEKQYSKESINELPIEPKEKYLVRKPQTTNKKVIKPPFETYLWALNEKDIHCTILEDSCKEDGYFAAIKDEHLHSVNMIYSHLAHFYDDNKWYKPSLNEYCIAKFENEWSRAKVIDIENDEHFSVIYIDFKNENIITKEDIRRYPNDFKIDCHTVLCQINDFPEDINDEQRQFLNSYIGSPGNKIVVDGVVNVNDEIVLVEMRDLIKKLADFEN